MVLRTVCHKLSLPRLIVVLEDDSMTDGLREIWERLE